MHTLNVSGLATYVNSPEIARCMMRQHRVFLSRGFLVTAMLLGGAAPAASGQTISSPPARKSDVVDDYHGTRVPDPYRWLEDSDSPETRAWIDGENQITESYLSQIAERATIRQRLTQLWNYPKYGAPFHNAGRFFFFKNDGLQNQAVLYRQVSVAADAEVLLDPNVLSQDGTVALSTLAVSEDGRLLAYGTSAGGSDWGEFRVRDIATARDRSDHLRWIKFSGAPWDHDDRGVFYMRYPAGARDRDRHSAAGARALARDHPAGRGRARGRPDHPRCVRRALHARCSFAAAAVRAGRPVSQGRRTAHPRGCGVDLGRAQGRPDVLRVHLVPLPHDDLPVRLHSGHVERLQGAGDRLRSVGLRDEPGVLRQQGRHAGADVRHPQEGHQARRVEPARSLRLPGVRHQSHAQLLGEPARVARAGWCIRGAEPAWRRRVR